MKVPTKLITRRKGIVVSLLVMLGIVAYFYRGLVLEPGIIADYDFAWFFLNLEEGGVYNQWFQTWNSTSVLFGPRFGLETLFSPLYFILTKLGIPTPSIYLYGMLLLSALVGYFFVYHYTLNIYASTAAGTFYAINWIIENIADTMLIFSGYVMLPILFLLFDRALVKGRYRDIVYFALFIFIFVPSVHQQFTYFAMLLLFLFALARLTLAREASFLSRFARTSKVSLLAVVMVLGLVSYQILPYLAGARAYFTSMTFGPEEVSYLSTPLFTKFALVTNLYTISVASNYFVLGTVLATLAFSALLFRRDVYTLFFAMVALVGIFLAKGPLPPFAPLFNWLWENFPLMDTFRQAHRWLMLTSLAYLFLLGVILKHLTDWLQTSPRIKFAKLRWVLNVTLTIVVLGVIFLSTKPLFNPYSQQGFNPEQYPEYREARAAYDLIGSRHEDIYNTFLLLQNTLKLNENIQHPTYDSLNYYQTSNPMGWLYPLSGQPVLRFPEQWQGLENINFGGFIDYQVQRGTMTNVNQILGALNIKYIMVDKAKPGPYVDFFQMQDNIIPIYEGETLALFENKSALPHVYATASSARLAGGPEALSVLQSILGVNFDNVNLLPARSTRSESPLVLFNADADEFIMLNEDRLPFAQKLDIDRYAKIPWWRMVKQEENSYWIRSTWWYARGEFVFNNSHLRTNGRNILDVPFKVNQSGDYEMWFRIAFAPDRGQLTALVDSKEIPQFPIIPLTPSYFGFKTVKVTLYLEKGDHVLNLSNDGTGYNDIDEIVLLNKGAMESVSEYVTDSVAYLFDGYSFPESRNLQGSWEGSPITDENQSVFWKIIEPEQVTISDDNNLIKHGDNSLKVEVSGERQYWTVFSYRFPTVQDWSGQEFISFYFYGNNTLNTFGMAVQTDVDEDSTSFEWVDDWIGWRQLSFPIDMLKIDWSKVRYLKVGAGRAATGTWYFDHFRTVVEGVSKGFDITSDLPPIPTEFRPVKPGNYMVSVLGLGVDTRHQVLKYMPSAVIAADEELQFWTATDPDHVRLTNNTDLNESGTVSLEVETSEKRKYAGLFYHKFDELQDWSSYDAISLIFYGGNSGYDFELVLGSLNYELIQKFSWKDDLTGWKPLTFALDMGLDWSEVERMTIGTSPNPVNGTWYFGHLTLNKTEQETVGDASEDAKLRVKIGGESITFGDTIKFGTEFGWLTAGPLKLDDGLQTIELSSEGEVKVDKLLLYPTESLSRVNNLFKADGNVALTYEKLAPTRYRVHVKADSPFWAVLTEIYHPLWYAEVDGESIQSTENYLGLNSFHITKTGEYDFSLEFKPQRYLRYGAIISLSTLVFMVLGWVFAERRAKRKNRINK